jgi:hypothetical protein
MNRLALSTASTLVLIFILTASVDASSTGTWTGYAGNAVLESGPSGTWDEDGVLSVEVVHDGMLCRTRYSGSRPTTGLLQIGCATSTNGATWVKYTNNPVLEVGTEGTWDELVTTPSNATPAPLSPQIAITPTAWVYLPLVSREEHEPVYTSCDLSSHSVFAECNPGGASSCSCSELDVSIASLESYGEVMSNPRRINTYVNAIGAKKFVEVFPDSKPITLGVYSYSGQFNLPITPTASVSQMENAQAIHMMIQLWDGRNALYQSNKTTLEGAIYWNLNAWTSDFGHILVYTGGSPLVLVDTGITATVDINWHRFELVVDLENQEYVSITVDGKSQDLSHLDLARVPQTWGNELALSITTESLATWPGPTCPLVFTWTTRFRDLELRSWHD